MQLISKLITTIGIATLIGGITLPVVAEPISPTAPILVARKNRNRNRSYIRQPRRLHRSKIPRRHLLRRRRLGQFYGSRRYRPYLRGFRQGYFHQRHPLRIYYRHYLYYR